MIFSLLVNIYSTKIEVLHVLLQVAILCYHKHWAESILLSEMYKIGIACFDTCSYFVSS